jgi:hypothetical protein
LSIKKLFPFYAMITRNTITETMMRISALILLVAFILSMGIAPSPASAAGLSISPIEGTVGSEITIVGVTTYGTGDFSIYWGDTEHLLKQGSTGGDNTVSFKVPEAQRGKHKVILKMGEDSFDTEFKVLPSIELSESNGSVDNKITIDGRGFNANEGNIDITFDGEIIATGIKAGSKGSWQKIVELQPVSSGEHYFDASGTTPADEVADQVFVVEPKININPTAGGVGTMVAINGTGFGSNETGIVVTYDGLAVKTSIASGAKGSWQTSFFIPASPKGRHSIDAYGAVTEQGDVSEAIFNVSPSIKVELAEGYLGDTITIGDGLWISGIGFEENESRIQLTYDGTMIASGIIADAKGSWAIKLEVPLSTSGKHAINASGETTAASDITAVYLVVSPQIEISPTSGSIGEEIGVSGNGFGGGQKLTVTYDGNKIDVNASTDEKGKFSLSFTVPESNAGDHSVTIADTSASVSSALFTVESNPPPSPTLISPRSGSTIGFLGKTIVIFEWNAVEDPSGVIYTLELGMTPDFSVTALRKEGLTETTYTLSEEESLEKGEYFWRIKAIDGAGNEGEWTTTNAFKAGVMEWWHLIIIIVCCIILLAIAWRIFTMTRRGSWK